MTHRHKREGEEEGEKANYVHTMEGLRGPFIFIPLGEEISLSVERERKKRGGMRVEISKGKRSTH